MSFVTIAVDEYRIKMRIVVFDEEPDRTVTEEICDYLKCAFETKNIREMFKRLNEFDWDAEPIIEDGVRGCRFTVEAYASGRDEDEAIERLEYRNHIRTCEFHEVTCEFVDYDYWEVEEDY